MGNAFKRRSSFAVMISTATLTGAVWYATQAQANPPVCVFVNYVPSAGLPQRPDGPILDAGVDHDNDGPRPRPPAGARFLPPETGASATPPEAWLGVPGVQVIRINSHSYYRCRYG